MIEAERQEPGKPASRQTRFYIGSIAADAVEFAHAARQHWGIENGLHWVLDVILREDECRIRKLNGPANFATIRHITLNLLQRTKTAKDAPKPPRKRASASNEASLPSTKPSCKPFSWRHDPFKRFPCTADLFRNNFRRYVFTRRRKGRDGREFGHDGPSRQGVIDQCRRAVLLCHQFIADFHTGPCLQDAPALGKR
jgi:predicted transposase YbfD/YdcC